MVAYLRATMEDGPATTARYRASVLQRFVDWATPSRPVEALSALLLRRYARHLERDGVRSAARYVALVEQVWAWAYERDAPWPSRLPPGTTSTP